jgi:hypothetical protein
MKHIHLETHQEIGVIFMEVMNILKFIKEYGTGDLILSHPQMKHMYYGMILVVFKPTIPKRNERNNSYYFF